MRFRGGNRFREARSEERGFLTGTSRVALRGTKPAVAEETQRVGLSRCALGGWFVCLQGSLRLGPAAAQGRRIGLAIERGLGRLRGFLSGMSRLERGHGTDRGLLTGYLGRSSAGPSLRSLRRLKE